MAVKRGLGRGLDALFIDNEIEANKEEFISISKIEPNKGQPRKFFDDASLTELADSIRVYGLIQPILVRPLISGNYQIIAGERRWRASRIAGLFEVPVIVKEMTDSDVMKIALVENLQRENLNPIEESLGFKNLMDEFSLTQDEVAKSVGKARSIIANALRILNLPKEIIDMIGRGELSKGHGKVLLSIDNDDDVVKFGHIALEKGLSVRELEQAIKVYKKSVKEKTNDSTTKVKPFYIEAQVSLKEHLGTDVRIKQSKNKCVLEIDFFSDEDLNNILGGFKF